MRSFLHTRRSLLSFPARSSRSALLLPTVEASSSSSTTLVTSSASSASTATAQNLRTALYSSTAVSDLDHRKLVIERSATLKPKTPKEQLRFGAQFTDHMLTVAWDKASGWDRPHIKPYQALQLDPASSVFHYGLECYEGMKVYMDGSGKLRMFRPIENMNRFNRSCARLVLPTLNAEALLECIKELVRLDRDWVPQGKGYSLYIRPCMISTYQQQQQQQQEEEEEEEEERIRSHLRHVAWLNPKSFLGVAAAGNALCFVILSPVGPYYRSGWRPVKLLADTKYVRAWPGGTGNAKVGGNYGATVLAQKEAEERGYNQILWLYGPNNEITEVGTMNMFVAIRGKNGEKELVTAPATPQGVVLSGITRDSIIQLVRKLPDWRVSERACPIAEIIEAQEEGRLIEAFGCGTAAVVSPIESVTFRDKVISFPLGPMGKAGELTQRLSDTLTSIQYGEVPHEWSVAID